MAYDEVVFRPVINPQDVLARVDPKVWALFRAGAELNVWRNSSPHNWWLERQTRRGPDTVYHWPERCSPDRAFFLFSRKRSVSEQRVTYGGWMRGGDEGMPVSEVWVYDDKAFQAAVDRWDRAVACAETFNRLEGTAAADPKSLDLRQRWILRTLKRGKRKVEMSPEYMPPNRGYGHPSDVDLCARGLTRVDPAGYLVGTELLKRTTIPVEKKYLAAEASTLVPREAAYSSTRCWRG